MISVYLIAIIIVIVIFYSYWTNRRIYAASAKFKGPKALPLVGNALTFLCKTDELYERMYDVVKQEGNEPHRFWLGPYLVIILKNPVHLEKVMSSQKFAYKHDVYHFIEKVAGDGLISASGSKPIYKLHRRLIQPMFDLKFVLSILPIIRCKINICMDKLNGFVNEGSFDVLNVIGPCSMDIITEIIMGQNINIQDNGYSGLCKLFIRLLEIEFTRMAKVWLYPDFIFNLHPIKKEEDKIIAEIKSFINDCIVKSRQRKLSHNQNQSELNYVPIIDKLVEFAENNPDKMDQKQLIDHLITLICASEDPFAIISSFAVVCFGMYPDYQQKAFEEIQTIIGSHDKEISVEDIYKLTYLDMCLKDVLRLFPIAPLILRKTIEDFQLDKWLIPKGAGIVIPIQLLHKNPEIWENPEHFHPDHFLPEVVQKRHPYAYLPFSAGPRGCIGKTLANTEIKLFLAKFLQRFEVSAEGKVPDIKLKADISVRPKNGYICKISIRKWAN